MKGVVVSIVIACIAVMAATAKPVKVVVMTESLCPDCILFAKTDLKELLQAEGVFESTAIQYLAWGNAYTETTSKELCPSPTPGKYDSTVRKCWSTRCVRSAAPELFAECFNKSFKDHITCQHGEEENYGNLIESCAVHISRDPSTNLMSRTGAKFVECFLGENKGQKQATQYCAREAGIDYNSIMKCVNTTMGYALLSEEAVETNDYGTHPGVPYILVNGRELPESKTLVTAVCEEIKGTKPKGCHSTVSATRTYGKC